MSIIWAVHYIRKAWSGHMLISSIEVFLVIPIQLVTGMLLAAVLLFIVLSRLCSAKLSTECANEARAEVLRFLDAPKDYTVIFTANATAAFKLVAEAFPFVSGGSYVLGADSHNSVCRQLIRKT